jgi:hypothetical protein
MAERVLPDKNTLEHWHEEGLTHQEMANRFYALTGHRCTRQAFRNACGRYGLTRNYSHDEWLPADLRREHQRLYDTEMIRRWSARKQGKKYDAKEEQRINAWLQNLRDAGAILVYKRDTMQGWWPVHREPTDDPNVPVRVEQQAA